MEEIGTNLKLQDQPQMQNKSFLIHEDEIAQLRQ